MLKFNFLYFNIIVHSFKIGINMFDLYFLPCQKSNFLIEYIYNVSAFR